MSTLGKLDEGIKGRGDRAVSQVTKIKCDRHEGKHQVGGAYVRSVSVGRRTTSHPYDSAVSSSDSVEDCACIIMEAAYRPVVRVPELAIVGPHDFLHGQSQDGREGEDLGQDG